MSSPLSALSSGSNGVPAVFPEQSNSVSLNIDNTSTAFEHNVDTSMDEANGCRTSFVSRQTQATESLAKMQDTINSLTIQLTVLAARMCTPNDADNLEALNAEYLQKDTLLKTLLSTKSSIEKANAASLKYVQATVDPTAPIKVSSICPSNLPHLQWVGEVHEPSAHVFPDAAACLTRFQNVMYAHRLDFDTNYDRLILSQMSHIQLTWYNVEFQQNARAAGISVPTWTMFKNEFLARFGTTVDEDRADCALQLVNIKLTKGESLFSFIDRFNDLRRRAVDQCLPAPVLVDKFLHALPREFADKVITSRLSYQKLRNLTLTLLCVYLENCTMICTRIKVFLVLVLLLVLLLP
jgi:hypothetical protein